MLKKPTGLLLTCGNRHPINSKGNKSKTSSLPSKILPPHKSCRSYATSSASPKSDGENINWPIVSSNNVVPTPYEIFNQKKSSPYSKQRFYELVKLYHPDRHDIDSRVAGLSYETKLERYRLVIAANNILGDPVRRSAYDRYGAGWNGQTHAYKNEDLTRNTRRSAEKGWYNGPGGPSQNATWEDWERWYAHDESAPQDPNYVSNAAFVGLILTFALLGGVGQATRATNHSFSFLEQRNALHHKVSMELAQSRKESTQLNFQEERIQRFMRIRDPIGNGIDGLKEDYLKRDIERSDHRLQDGSPEISREGQKNDNHDNISQQ